MPRLPAWTPVAACVAVSVVALATALLLAACSGEATAPPATDAADDTDVALAQAELAPGEPADVDLDGDGLLETVLFDPDDRTILIEDGAITYRSRERWVVVQAMLGDLDGDGLPEVVTLLDSEAGRHIGLFAYFGGEYRERLVSQAIDPAPLRLRVIALPGREQGKTAPGATEASDLLELLQPSPGPDGETHVILLRWNGFGFTRIE